MTVLKDKRGAWINQFAQPTASMFLQRGKQVDYVVIKYGLSLYEGLARQGNIPWVAERMGEEGAGTQNGPANAIKYGTELANQANQPGCIAAIINLEEADGGWHNDNGDGVRALVSTYRGKCNKPLFASLDVRGSRANLPYQKACAQSCDGVMPMLYPGAFQQSVPAAIEAVMISNVYVNWVGKEVIPTVQTYGSLSPQDVQIMCNLLGVIYAGKQISGINAYTLGHASQNQWDAFIGNTEWANGASTPPSDETAREALLQLRINWLEQWTSIALRGTVDEAVALAAYWKRLVS